VLSKVHEDDTKQVNRNLREDVYVKMKLAGIDLCVGIEGDTATAKLVNGAKVQLETCKDWAGAQQWKMEPDGSIRNRWSGKCLEAGGSGEPPSNKAFIWDCNSAEHQKWIQASDRRLQNKKLTNKYLGVMFGASRLSSDRYLELRNFETGQYGENQKWPLLEVRYTTCPMNWNVLTRV